MPRPFVARVCQKHHQVDEHPTLNPRRLALYARVDLEERWRAAYSYTGFAGRPIGVEVLNNERSGVGRPGQQQHELVKLRQPMSQLLATIASADGAGDELATCVEPGS